MANKIKFYINKGKSFFINRKKKKEVIKSTKTLLPFRNDYNGHIQTKTGYMDILQIKTRDLRSMNDSDLEYLFIVETRFLRTYPHPFKEVTLNFPSNCDTQKRFWETKRMNTTLKVLLDFIDRKIFEFNFLENNRTNREYFIFVYADTPEALEERTNTIKKVRESSFPLIDISKQKKRDVLYLMNNQNSKVMGSTDDTDEKDSDIKAETELPELDVSFISEIQSQGGVIFKDKYVKKGDGYEACVYVYAYPTQVNVLWLEEITSDDSQIIVKDVSTMNKQIIVDSINKSMLEHSVRHRGAKDESSRIDAQSGYQEMEKLYSEIREMGEEVKLVSLRIYVHAPTLDNLEEKINSVQSDLTGNNFRGSVILNRTAEEWKSMFDSYDTQMTHSHKREGKGIPSMPLASGLPYNFADLNDKNGSYLGESSTGGNVLFDLFHIDDQRRFYNAVVVGKMGAGKSTLLKKLTFDNASRGNFIRGFDVTGEFEVLVKALNGHTIALDGSQGIINPLEINKTADSSDQEGYDEKEGHIKDQDMSFMRHISKVATIYEYLSSNPENDLEEFKRILREFYDSLGFKMGSGKITDLPSESYPIFEDLLEYVNGILYEDIDQKEIRANLTLTTVTRLENIILVLDNLVHAYGYIFNGHTTIPDFANEKVVFFSIRNLLSLEKPVFNAQMYSALNMIWDNLITIGSPQLKKSGEPDFDVDGATRLLVLIDEAHRMINADNMLAVDFLTDFSREARKYFGGLVLASQSIRDFVPDYSDTATVTKIKTLFELTQYKFIMQQDTNTLGALNTIFDGEMSESDLSQIPQFQRGECLLSISGVENIQLDIEASSEELRLFTGGL